MDLFNPYTLQVITLIVLNLILAISIFITLSTGQLSLGHAGFMSIGAYTAAMVTKSGDGSLTLGLLLGTSFAGIVALIIGLPTLRLHGLYLAIATLGFGEVVRVILLNLPFTNGALGITGLTSIGSQLYDFEKAIGLKASALGFSVLQMKAFSTLLFLLLFFGIILFFTIRLNNSRTGRAFSAIKADETAALAMGVNITHYKMLAFIIGAMLAGLAGGIYAHLTTAITPDDFNYHRVVEILSFAVIGGIEVLAGPLIGAVLLTATPEIFRGLAEFKMFFYGALILLVMAFRPQGLVSTDLLSKWKLRKKTSNSASMERKEGL